MVSGQDSAVVGVDIGSSTVKACLFDLSSDLPRLLDQRSLECGLRNPQAGWFEHPLQAMASAVQSVLEVAPQGTAVGWSSAMHALVLLDKGGRPLCDALSWADGRSCRQAQDLQRSDPDAYLRTGTPLHPMGWPAKLRWVQEQRPDWWEATARVTDLKSYLWEAVLGAPEAPLDRSSASATGLWNSRDETWDKALVAELGHVKLPKVVSQHCQVWRGSQHHLGGADGPLGNLGLGAVGEGRIAVSVGTSGAIRRYRDRRQQVCPGLFLYAMAPSGWIEGGAISNGGSVLDWLQKQKTMPTDLILELAKHQPPGAGGAQVYPYFLGERAPYWLPDVQPLIVGNPDFAQLVRATLEGVAFCLRRLLDLLDPNGQQPLYCTGGLFESEVWRAIFSSVAGRSLQFGSVEQATALGAAFLTQDNPLERSGRLPSAGSVDPDPKLMSRYHDLYRRWLAGDPLRQLG